MMPDGSPPPQRALIERMCQGMTPIQETVAGKNGEFYWKAPNEIISMQVGSGSIMSRCFLRARVKELESDLVDIQDRKILSNLQLPTMVLRPRGAREQEEGPRLPPAVLKSWRAAVAAYREEQWAEAERLAREVARAAPQFAAAWNAAGLAAAEQKKYPEARAALRRAFAAEPSSIPYRLQLLRVELTMKLWEDASQTAAAILKTDTAHRYPEAELNYGIARYMLNDNEAARASWERFLTQAPSSSRAGEVRAKLEEMARETRPAPTVSEALLAPEPEPEYTPGAEATIPGGRRALAAMASLSPVPPASTFFLEYCRAIAAQNSRTTTGAIPKYAAKLGEFLTTAAGLADLGETKGGRSVLHLSLADAKTEKAMALLGWRVVKGEGAAHVEPGDRPEDGLRQLIPRALGIDEVAMKQALDGGGVYEAAVETETATVAGGAAWNTELREFPALPGGIAEAFARDARLARVYVGLASLPAAVAAAMVKSMGLRGLVAQHQVLWLYGDALRVENGAAAVPGGPGAEAVWAKLTGASPREPARFFEALLTADHGRLAAFYAAVARGDAGRQRFFTADLARAQQWLAWYRASDELRDGIGVIGSGWETRAFSALPIDEHGRPTVEVPGPDLEAALAIAELGHRRGRPLDAESAQLLTKHFAAWHSLFPYFEMLPALGADEFRALEKFTSDAAARPHAAQETLLAEWHSAAALIVLGRKSGALDDAAAARAFGRLCRSEDAAGTLRDIAGGPGSLGDAVKILLRLNEPRRAAFERIRELQKLPALDAAPANGRERATALAGAVYAASLDPDGLLVNEDRDLVRKHVFAPRGAGLFASAALSGSHFTGGFMGFDTIASRLARAHARDADPAAPPATAPVTSSDAPATLFHASGRLVEINATVTDERGRLLDGLGAEQFTVFDGGRAAPITAFENGAAPLSCVLLLDTSQSMDTAIAALKRAAMRLIAGLRPGDSLAVYSLTGGISELQPFTTDKAAATRAVLRADIGELTALYDGLVRVNRDLAGRTGKKVIVVLTDGEDTASTLSAQTAILRARSAGVPIYTIAQGHALGNATLLKELGGMSDATGGKAFAIRTAAEIGPVFDRVLQDLLHGYLLAFTPAESDRAEWRRIEVRLARPGKVRARDGYYPE